MDFMQASRFIAPAAVPIQDEHQKYYVGDREVPGTTSICKLENQFLLKWGNKMGRKGIDIDKYLIHTGNNGTVFHNMAHCRIQEMPFFPLPEYEPYMSTALSQFKQFEQFIKDFRIRVIGSEMSLVHRAFKYGGTIDLYGELGNCLILIDWKTSDGFYTTAKLQLAAYYELLVSNGFRVDKAFIVRFPRDGSEYKIQEVIQIEHWFWRFVNLRNNLAIMEAQKDLNADGSWREVRKESRLWLKDNKIKGENNG